MAVGPEGLAPRISRCVFVLEAKGVVVHDAPIGWC